MTNKKAGETETTGKTTGKTKTNERSKREQGDRETAQNVSEAARKTQSSASAGGAGAQGAGGPGAKGQGANGSGGLDANKTAAAAGQKGAAKPTVSHMLGEVTWLLSQSPTHKHFTIGDLEWLVMPAILLEQFRVFHGDKHPLGFALWANLSEAAEARFKAQVEAGGGARLRPDEWKSGDRLWLIELVAPFATPDNKLQEAMLADLVQNVFAQRKFKFHVTDPATGKREEREIGG